MLVQLSPWETSRTSIRVPKSSSTPSRRRKRAGSKDGDDEEATGTCPAFAASMITMASKRSLSKMKLHNSEFSDCLPLLTLTADHHITVMGKDTVDDEESSSSYREFSSLRYNSRPGDAGSFFAKPENGKRTANDLPRIPAILDTKNDRVYALQHGNNRLACWDAWKGSGPDEKTAMKVELKYPALTMTLLPMNKGIIYGSCQNGTIYVARVVGASISVEYLPAKQPTKKGGAVHIGTFAEIDVEHGRASGKKRKMSDADGNSSVIFYQVFCDGASIKIVRNNVTLSISNSDLLIKNGSLVQNVASISLLNEGLSGQYCLTGTKLLVSSSGSAPKISVVYKVEATTSCEVNNDVHDTCLGTFCAAISLVSGDISNSPVRLSSQAKQFGLITETVLAAASNEIIHLYDLITGSTLQSISLKRIICDTNGEWVLHTNVKLGILAIFYPKEDHLHVAFSTATLDESKGYLGSKKLKSSSKLACSLLAYSKDDTQSVAKKFDMICDTGIYKDGDDSFALIRLDESVSTVLTALEETRRTLTSSGGESSSDASFRDAFDASVSSLKNRIDNSKDASTRSTRSMSMDSNPQDPSNETASSPKKSAKKLRNGKSNGGFTPSSSHKKNKDDEKLPSCLPQSFIDGTVQIAMSAILTENQDEKNHATLSKLGRDARFVLKSLLRSKRVSARLHFEGSYALQETGKKHPLVTALKCIQHPATENPLSALQMILEMITNCSDISERQLVVILDYTIRYAKTDDIVAICKKKRIRSNSTDLSAKVIEDENSGHKKNVVLAGVMLVLQMVVAYSECNETMLRVALAEELSSSGEAMVLARLLPTLLMSDPYRNPSRAESGEQQNFVKSVCQWIAALSESFLDDLRVTRITSEETYLSFLLNSVTKATKNSEAIMSFKDGIGVAELMKKNEKTNVRKDVIEAPQIADLMGYSIDRIVF
jgi:hypothetical protein